MKYLTQFSCDRSVKLLDSPTAFMTSCVLFVRGIAEGATGGILAIVLRNDAF